MGGIAALARELGHRVSGSDLNVYPPMSTQLEKLGIELTQGYDAAQLEPRADVIVVGNAMTRAKPVVEAMLDRGLNYISGPQWLLENVLLGRHVIAVAGTHGKTTTSSMIAWILQHAGLEPGFLIGGVPGNFDVTARLGRSEYFVIEADEYDTAFFDKRAKFVHYRPRTAVLNNLEHDHADIYPDVAAIRWQFHQLIRTVPAGGRLICNALDTELAATLAMGAWTPVDTFEVERRRSESPVIEPAGEGRKFEARFAAQRSESEFEIWENGARAGRVAWTLMGEHNMANAAAAVSAARQAGVSTEAAARALCEFSGVKRRMEIRARIGGVTVYDDFAHHPTAVETTLRGLRAHSAPGRIIAILEPRSNSMKLGLHRERLAEALDHADQSWIFTPKNLGWSMAEQVKSLGERAQLRDDVNELADDLARNARSGDHLVIMSNGGFGGLHEKLIERLRARFAQRALAAS